MKLITAVIKPHQVEEVKEALALLGVQGMTVTAIESDTESMSLIFFVDAVSYTHLTLPTIA